MTRNERKNTHARIRESMRRNEREVLAHLRTHRVHTTFLFGRSWLNAFVRLYNADKIYWNDGYRAKPYARAVTR